MIMELQHRLVRQAINIAVSKAMEDMKGNTRRGVRNLIDLGLLFSQSENQKWFFNTAKKIISNPKNPYNSLAARIVTDIDNDTVKKVGLNLGYNSLIYGANKLRKRQAVIECAVPWILAFDIYGSCSGTFHCLENLISEGQELGIYSYVFCLHEANDFVMLCEIAKRFHECLFVFQVPSTLITKKAIETLSKKHNAVVSIQMTDMSFRCENTVNAYRILKQNRCLYGFHVTYNEDNMTQIATPEYIHSAIELGNLFGVYVADNGVSDTCKNAVYIFACKERGEKGQPLIALEWFHDVRYVSEKILSGGGYMSIHLAEKAYGEYKKAKNALIISLVEMIRSMQPCTSS